MDQQKNNSLSATQDPKQESANSAAKLSRHTTVRELLFKAQDVLQAVVDKGGDNVESVREAHALIKEAIQLEEGSLKRLVRR
jgi:hypothetical protein